MVTALATAARDHAAAAGLCPAEAVWAVAGIDGQRLRLAELARYVTDGHIGEAA